MMRPNRKQRAESTARIDGKQINRRRHAIAVFRLLLISLAFGMPTSAAASGNTHHPKKFKVDCDRGQSLARTLRYAPSGSRVTVKGICYEQILIKRNRIRIQGEDGAIIDGSVGKRRYEGTITIKDASKVQLSNLTVRNGPDQGIALQHAHAASLNNIILSGHGTAGLTLDRSDAQLSNIQALSNRGDGIDIFTDSTAVAVGDITTTENGGAGLALNANSLLELRGSVVVTERNAGDGLLIVNDSDLMILSFPESQGSGVTAVQNGGNAGIFVANSSVSIVGSAFFGQGRNVFNIQQNGVGMLLTSSTFSSPFANARMEIANNGVGIILSDNANAFSVGGLIIANNAFGILADGAGVLALQQNPDTPSSISNNRFADVALSFGTRARIEQAIPVGQLQCDASVITPIALPPGQPPVYACP